MTKHASERTFQTPQLQSKCPIRIEILDAPLTNKQSTTWNEDTPIIDQTPNQNNDFWTLHLQNRPSTTYWNEHFKHSNYRTNAQFEQRFWTLHLQNRQSTSWNEDTPIIDQIPNQNNDFWTRHLQNKLSTTHWYGDIRHPNYRSNSQYQDKDS